MPDSNATHRFWSLTGSTRFIFRVMLVALMTSTAIGTTYAIVNRSAFVASFPGAANPTIYYGFLLLAVLGLATLVGLWTWRRWAVPVYGILAIGTIGLDALARAPRGHQMSVGAGAVITFLLIYLNRGQFSAPVSSASAVD